MSDERMSASLALDHLERTLREQGYDPHDPRVRNARARAYLRKRHRERVRRIALTLAPVAAFLLMFWRA